VQGASQECGIPRQTEGHAFSDRLIQRVCVTPSSVTETSFCCALFCVPMARVRHNLEQRVFIHDCYAKKKLIQIMQDTTCPSGDTISKLVSKVRTHGILIQLIGVRLAQTLSLDRHS
jgi:hypothetical protein